jgi:hypothetical protein
MNVGFRDVKLILNFVQKKKDSCKGGQRHEAGWHDAE